MIIYLIIMQGSYSGLYFLTWIKALRKLVVDPFFLGAIIPTVFTFALYGTIFLMAKGVHRAYMILAGFENITSKRKMAIKVLKYAVGYQAIAMVLQIGIEYVHYTLGKWLS